MSKDKQPFDNVTVEGEFDATGRRTQHLAEATGAADDLDAELTTNERGKTVAGTSADDFGDIEMSHIPDEVADKLDELTDARRRAVEAYYANPIAKQGTVAEIAGVTHPTVARALEDVGVEGNWAERVERRNDSARGTLAQQVDRDVDEVISDADVPAEIDARLGDLTTMRADAIRAAYAYPDAGQYELADVIDASQYTISSAFKDLREIAEDVGAVSQLPPNAFGRSGLDAASDDGPIPDDIDTGGLTDVQLDVVDAFYTLDDDASQGDVAAEAGGVARSTVRRALDVAGIDVDWAERALARGDERAARQIEGRAEAALEAELDDEVEELDAELDAEADELVAQMEAVDDETDRDDALESALDASPAADDSMDEIEIEDTSDDAEVHELEDVIDLISATSSEAIDNLSDRVEELEAEVDDLTEAAEGADDMRRALDAIEAAAFVIRDVTENVELDNFAELVATMATIDRGDE